MRGTVRAVPEYRRPVATVTSDAYLRKNGLHCGLRSPAQHMTGGNGGATPLVFLVGGAFVAAHPKEKEHMKYRLGLTAAVAAIGLMTGLGVASAHTPYEVTVTNNMDEELLAPILVAPVSEDGKVFVESYVSKEAEHQILTGDPGMLAAAIGDGAAVGHGMDGPPGVLLAPGKSVTFAFSSHAPQVRVLAMVAPTMYEDHYVSAVVSLNGEPMSVSLDRFDIGYDEGRKTIEPVAAAVATVQISTN